MLWARQTPIMESLGMYVLYAHVFIFSYHFSSCPFSAQVDNGPTVTLNGGTTTFRPEQLLVYPILILLLAFATSSIIYHFWRFCLSTTGSQYYEDNLSSGDHQVTLTNLEEGKFFKIDYIAPSVWDNRWAWRISLLKEIGNALTLCLFRHGFITSGKKTLGPIIGGAVGGGVGALLLAFLLFFYLRRRSQKKKLDLVDSGPDSDQLASELTQFIDPSYDPGYISPILDRNTHKGMGGVIRPMSTNSAVHPEGIESWDYTSPPLSNFFFLFTHLS